MSLVTQRRSVRPATRRLPRALARPAVLAGLGLVAFVGYVRALTWPVPSCSERVSAEGCAAAWSAWRDALPPIERLASEIFAWPLFYLLVAGLLVAIWRRRDDRGGVATPTASESIGIPEFVGIAVMVVVVALVTLVVVGAPSPDVVALPRGPIHVP